MRPGPAALALAGAALLLFLPLAAAKASVVATETDFANNRFEPSELRVAPGEAVEVRDAGRDSHTLTPVQPGAWAEVVVGPGEAKTFAAPTAPGDYRFYCRFHASPQADAARGEMAGVLHVAAGGAAPPPGGSAVPGAEAALLVAVLGGAALTRRRTGR